MEGASSMDLSAEENLRELLFAQLKRMAKLVAEFGLSWSGIQVGIKLNLLDKYYERFEENQALLERSGDHTAFQLRNEFEDLYSSVKESLLKLRENSNANSTNNSVNLEASGGSVRMRSVLPQIKLPSFDGNYSKWAEFSNMFKTLIDVDQSISDIEKFQTLRSCLVGEASSVIQSMECTPENYKKALDLLTQRYENKRLMFSAHINGILGMDSISRSSAQQCRGIVDRVNAEMRALQSLGSKDQIADGIVISTILSKLDHLTRTKWEEIADPQIIPSWNEFSDFLQKRCQTLEHIESVRGVPRNSVNINRKRDFKGKAIACAATWPKDSRCLLCHGFGHHLQKCGKYLGLSPKDRYKLIKKFRLCINCLRSGHSFKECAASSCLKCSRNHHTSLHFDSTVTNEVVPYRNNPQIKDGDLQAKEPPISNPTCLSASTVESSCETNVFIATAIVDVRSSSGIKTTARVLLDSASQVHFITRRLVQQLRAKEVRCQTTVSGVGSVETNIANQAHFTIDSRNSSFSTEISALVLPTITTNQPNQHWDISEWNIPSNLSLADPQFNMSGRIDLLLGAEIFMQLLCVGQISLAPNKPCLQKTVLGWVVSGTAENSGKVKKGNSLTVAINNANVLQHIDSLTVCMKRFWELEDLAKESKFLTLEEQRCEELFTATTTRNECGRFVVRLPLKDSPLKLGDSYNTALKRYSFLRRRLDRNPKLNQDYQNFMKEYEHLGHMQQISEANIKGNKYYIPHHGIEQGTGAAKKLRVVFDASCKTTSGVSLNDLLMTGSAIQGDLFSVLSRFRRHRFVFIADIVKMFRQILIHPDDIHLQSIFWNPVDNGPVKTFVLKTVTYGTACAPFLANRCIKELVTIYKQDFPDACCVLDRDTYVDDILTGSNTEEQLEQIRSQLVQVLIKAGMNLHKWCSNSKAVMQTVNKVTPSSIEISGTGETVKALGLVWHPSTDTFSYNLKIPHERQKITKRSVLSIIASLFDPLGLINPILVIAKIIMQDIWKCGVSWDESLPLELHSRWNEFVHHLGGIKDIRISRFTFQVPDSHVQILGFADASQSAYGGCVYLRVMNSSSEVNTNLLCAKSRVAPVKIQTLPRLELCAAVLLIELIDKLLKDIDIKPSEIYCWTDSSITLSWIAKPPATWTTFVAHRVATIQSISKTRSVIWKHVSTKNNPADILSRGAYPDHLRKNHLWFHGPAFLQQNVEEWPQSLYAPPPILENRKSKSICLFAEKRDITVKFKFINSYRKIVRIMAYAQRFVDLCRKIKISLSGHLSAEELNRGEIFIIRMIQRREYAEEIKALEQGKQLPRSSKLLNLYPFIDGNQVMRVGGRLQNADISFSMKHQIHA